VVEPCLANLRDDVGRERARRVDAVNIRAQRTGDRPNLDVLVTH
jgi:hypothetical protein